MTAPSPSAYSILGLACNRGSEDLWMVMLTTGLRSSKSWWMSTACISANCLPSWLRYLTLIRIKASSDLSEYTSLKIFRLTASIEYLFWEDCLWIMFISSSSFVDRLVVPKSRWFSFSTTRNNAFNILTTYVDSPQSVFVLLLLVREQWWVWYVVLVYNFTTSHAARSEAHWETIFNLQQPRP